MKAVAYIRVSTKEQDENNQRQAIQESAKSKDIEILGWFIDKGVSGTKKFKEREGARTLLNYIKTNSVDAVLVFAIDRLGRNMEDTVNTIKELENFGVKVISVKEEFLQTMDNNIRKLILSILSWVAEFERKRLRERQLAAWEAGKQKGRPPKLTDATLKRYLKKYPDLTIRSLWKIMRADGIEISYDWLRKRVKKIRRSAI
ncbi:recombinase family protein [Thermococcus sp.]